MREQAMVVSSRIRLRGLNVSRRHELLAEATGLDEILTARQLTTRAS
jgi:hypothetical protein